MSLYPSLEDMKVDNMVRAQMAHHQAAPSYSLPPAAPMPSAPSAHVYPALGEYMGLELSSDVIAVNMPEYQLQTVSFAFNYLATTKKKICRLIVHIINFHIVV